LAGSLAAGVKANFGTMTKPLHVGHCGRNGLLAVLLAERGFTANPLALEHKQGFLNAFNGAGNFDAGRIFEDWAAPLEIESALMGLKQFPCCGSTHPAVSMALLLVHEEHVKADDIESIHIQSHMRRLPHTDNPNPQTSLAAKFSVQYAVARALLSTNVTSPVGPHCCHAKQPTAPAPQPMSSTLSAGRTSATSSIAREPSSIRP